MHDPSPCTLMGKVNEIGMEDKDWDYLRFNMALRYKIKHLQSGPVTLKYEALWIYPYAGHLHTKGYLQELLYVTKKSVRLHLVIRSMPTSFNALWQALANLTGSPGVIFGPEEFNKLRLVKKLPKLWLNQPTIKPKQKQNWSFPSYDGS